MKFKRNITATVACVSTELLLSVIPSIVFIYIFIVPNKIDELFSSLLVPPYLALIFNVILILISILASLFIRESYRIEDDGIFIDGGSHTKTVKYTEIRSIVYDLGQITSKYQSKSSQLIIFDEEYKELLRISNPSLLMVHKIKKKCGHAKFEYDNGKRFLYILLLTNAVSIACSLLFKFYA